MANQKPRRQYDKQFKIDAVKLTLKGDKTAKEIADALGINPHVLYRWRLKYMASKEDAFPGTVIQRMPRLKEYANLSGSYG